MRMRDDRNASREHPEHRVDDIRIPLRSAAVLEHLQRLTRSDRLTIRPLADHRVERISNGHDPRFERNARPEDAVWISGVVVAFVVRAHDNGAAL